MLGCGLEQHSFLTRGRSCLKRGGNASVASGCCHRLVPAPHCRCPGRIPVLIHPVPIHIPLSAPHPSCDSHLRAKGSAEIREENISD